MASPFTDRPCHTFTGLEEITALDTVCNIDCTLVLPPNVPLNPEVALLDFPPNPPTINIRNIRRFFNFVNNGCIPDRDGMGDLILVAGPTYVYDVSVTSSEINLKRKTAKFDTCGQFIQEDPAADVLLADLGDC